jgi:FkbM family methyltransferase
MARLRSGRLPSMVATFSDGRRFRIGAGDLMYEQIYRLGEYEPEVTETIRSILRPGDFAVDLGANHGWFSVVMARAVGASGAVWAIEPGAAMVAALQSNLELNPGLPVTVHRLAVADAGGEVLLHHFSDLPHGHASTSALGREAFDTERVRCVVLDELLAGAGAPPALVKMDVEGSELKVLQGATALLAARASMWVIEVNYETSAAFDYAPVELLRAFTDDHAIYRVHDGGLAPEDDPAAAPHGTMWLCVPPALRDRTDGLIAA